MAQKNARNIQERKPNSCSVEKNYHALALAASTQAFVISHLATSHRLFFDLLIKKQAISHTV